jgi:hypothetical protein
LFHWTNGTHAAIVFSLEPAGRSLGVPSGSLETPARSREALGRSVANVGRARLRIKLSPFLVPGHLEVQRLDVELNHALIAALELRTGEPQVYSVELKWSALREQNVLEFNLPDAQSPQALGLSDDARLLGINVEWIELSGTVATESWSAPAERSGDGALDGQKGRFGLTILTVGQLDRYAFACGTRAPRRKSRAT